MIRVLIERRVRSGRGHDYERMQPELRFEALREHGDLTGETCRRVLDRLAPLIESERIALYEHA